MTGRIFRSICLVAIAVFLASLALIMGVLYDYYGTVQFARLRAEVDLTAIGMEEQGEGFLHRLTGDEFRVTWIAADGRVLYDSASDIEQMENHSDREEVVEALRSGYGECARYSSTILRRNLYSAKRLPDGTVLRLSDTQYSLLSLFLGMLQPIAAIALMAVVLSMILASSLSRSIVAPLNRLNLDQPLENRGYEEIKPLLNRIDSQQRQIQHQREELKRKEEEFDAATGNMREGLLILNEHGDLLSANRAAKEILRDIPDQGDTQETIQALVGEALQGHARERDVVIESRHFHVEAQPICNEERAVGAALVFFDMTEQARTEQIRREFTANVSHELKTPLHSISGCAELLLSGLVREEDREQFQHQIYREAQRMIVLVEDIIRLSRLDEGEENAAREWVSLYSLAGEVLSELKLTAENAGVTLSLVGEEACIYGAPQVLSGLIRNLCDNAIKYNRENGSVTVRVGRMENEILFEVSDTGIGIPEEHRERIFERFYRVDKSHSKAVGGTGLGLSIVKHAARMHGAKIDLKSLVGEGTTVTVRFPAAEKRENIGQ